MGAFREYGPSNAIIEAYVQGYHGLVKTLVSSIYYYQDELGSTSHIADVHGALLEYYEYDLYGKPRVYDASGTYQANATPVAKDLFTGQRWIPELGLYDDRNRFMSPDLGRFLQPDPIGFKGDSSNLYRYCGNDWANRSDPMGTDSWPDFQSGSTKWQHDQSLLADHERQWERGTLGAQMINVARITVRTQQDLMMGFTMNGNQRSSFSAKVQSEIANGPRLAQAGAVDPRGERSFTEPGTVRVDTDGTGPSHGEPRGQHRNETSYQPNGHSLNSDTDRYVAVPTADQRRGVRLGDRVIYSANGHSAPGVVGDYGGTGYGEGSLAIIHDVGIRTRDVPGVGPVPVAPGGRDIPASVTVFPSGPEQ